MPATLKAPLKPPVGKPNKILEARILELLNRISHLEEENTRLKNDLSSKTAQLQAAQTKVSIAAEQLHIELDRLRAFKDRYRNP